MAPELFPFIVCVGLAMGSLIIAIAAIFISKTRQLLELGYISLVKSLRLILIITLLITLGLLFIAVSYVHKQYFLNEPLESAAGSGDTETIHKLLDYGASPNAWGVDFMSTALITATRTGRIDIVKILLEHGADPNLHDSNCKTALQYARDKRYVEIEHLLLKMGAH